MTTIMGVIGLVVLGIGILMILISAITFRRKEEAEISMSLIEVPTFKLGIVLVIIGLVLKLLFR